MARRFSVAGLSRWVWLINGLVVLVALLVTGVTMLSGWLRYGRDRGAQQPGPDSSAAHRPPAPVRYDPPQPLPGSEVRLVLMRSGRGLPSGPLPSGSAYRGAGEIVNVGFLAPDGGARLLLDRPARILWVSYPGAPDWLTGPLEPAAGQRHIAYAIAGDSDAASLYLSARDGTGLRRVLPEGLRIQAVRSIGTASVVVALGDSGQRTFVMEGDSVRPYAALDSLAARAAAALQ